MVTSGDSAALSCDLDKPEVDGVEVDVIVSWRKQGDILPLIMQFNDYPPAISANYTGNTVLCHLQPYIATCMWPSSLFEIY